LVAATQAHIGLNLARAAQPHQRALLQRAQQLGLQRQRQLADLVQEQGAAIGLLEPASAGGGRAGEGAALVAKQLALEQGLGNGRAVDLDERPGAPATGQVHRARKQLFAGARIAQQQHRGLRVSCQ
jgi:hypothetical protein